MKELKKMLGLRIRAYRMQKEMSQEKLAELAGCHPTYIGQLERGEKNATIESIAKIALALDLPLAVLFENIGGAVLPQESTAQKCYELLLSKSVKEQERLYRILLEIEEYKTV